LEIQEPTAPITSSELHYSSQPKLLCYWSLEAVTQKFEVMESERSPGAAGLIQDLFSRVDTASLWTV